LRKNRTSGDTKFRKGVEHRSEMLSRFLTDAREVAGEIRAFILRHNDTICRI